MPLCILTCPDLLSHAFPLERLLEGSSVGSLISCQTSKPLLKRIVSCGQRRATPYLLCGFIQGFWSVGRCSFCKPAKRCTCVPVHSKRPPQNAYKRTCMLGSTCARVDKGCRITSPHGKGQPELHRSCFNWKNNPLSKSLKTPEAPGIPVLQTTMMPASAL